MKLQLRFFKQIGFFWQMGRFKKGIACSDTNPKRLDSINRARQQDSTNLDSLHHDFLDIENQASLSKDFMPHILASQDSKNSPQYQDFPLHKDSLSHIIESSLDSINHKAIKSKALHHKSKNPTPHNNTLFYKPFKAFVKKEFYRIFRDIRTILILVCMPIVQLILFGFALSSEVRNAKFALLDMSADSLSKHITLAFKQSPYFSLFTHIESKQGISGVFDSNKVDFALIFPTDFARTKVMQIILDASDPNRASTIYMYASNVIYDTIAMTSQSPTSQNLANQRIIPHTTMLFNPQGKSAYTFVPGLLDMILMLICAMMTSISIVREKEQGSMEVLLVSPIKPIFVIISKLTPYFLLSSIILAIVLVVCVFLLDLHIVGSLSLLLSFCMLYILLALSIGLLVSNLAKTQVVAMLVCAMLFLMPIMMLSGMMFPIESMPAILQYLSHIIPTKWFIIGVKKIMIEGLTLSYLLQEVAILSGMLCVILALSLKTFKIRL